MNSKMKLFTLFLFITSIAFGQQKQTDHASDTLETGLIKVSIMYPYAEGKTFNMEYYEKTHMPMVANLLGSNLVKYTIEKGVASGIPNSPLPFSAIGIFYIKDLGEYQEAITPKRDEIRADFANYTSITPIILVSEVIR